MKKIWLLCVLLISSCSSNERILRYENVQYFNDDKTGATNIYWTKQEYDSELMQYVIVQEKKWSITDLRFVYYNTYSEYSNIFYVYKGSVDTYKLVIFNR